MGRREDRARIESTWSVYEPRVRGVPMRARDIEDADARPVTPSLDVDASSAIPLTLLARAVRSGT